MSDFRNRIMRHVEHVQNVGPHCDSEETTKQALILPFLDILGFSPYDPTKVKAEFAADFPGVKINERVDYALFCNGVPVMFIEAKAFRENLANHAPQLSRYFNAMPEVTIGAITNGREWRFFTDLADKNVMDKEPFLDVDFTRLGDADIGQIGRFCYDRFQPDALRTLAEESVFLAAFKDVVKKSVLECDADFVRYVAGKSAIQRTLTAKFMDGITPIVKQAVAQTMGEMVASNLSAPLSVPEPDPITEPADSDQADPNNPKIITTTEERRLFTIVSDLIPNEDIHPKDTESYYTILYQNKVNRWLLRYHGCRKRPILQFGIVLNDEQRREITRAGLEMANTEHILLDRPEHIQRITGLIFDALAYCKNDDNFRIKPKSGG